MTKITKLLTLIPLVALGAACNGASPTAPDTMAAPDAGVAYDSSKAVDASAVPACRNIKAIELNLLPTTDQTNLILATYVSLGGSTARCAAPVWTSNPRNALISDVNPFRTRVSPNFKTVTVFARSPNGVLAKIVINNGVQAEAIGCQNITGVNLTLAPTSQSGSVVRATYVALGGTIDTRCGVPVWTSNPAKALIAETNPYKTRVNPTYKSVTVFATAPNGVVGSILVTNGAQTSAVICNNITGVRLTVALAPRPGTSIIRASYISLGGTDTRCAAPVWTSDPTGALIGDSNPYKNRVSPLFRSATVFATAPNGVRGQIFIKQ